jgi:hypothetical protein
VQRVVTPFFYRGVDEFGAVITVKLQKREGNDLENIPERLESPGKSLIEQRVEENPA